MLSEVNNISQKSTGDGAGSINLTEKEAHQLSSSIVDQFLANIANNKPEDECYYGDDEHKDRIMMSIVEDIMIYQKENVNELRTDLESTTNPNLDKPECNASNNQEDECIGDSTTCHESPPFEQIVADVNCNPCNEQYDKKATTSNEAMVMVDEKKSIKELEIDKARTLPSAENSLKRKRSYDSLPPLTKHKHQGFFQWN